MWMFAEARAVAATALVLVCGAGMAAASPPVPLMTRLDDMARAELVVGGTVAAPPRTDAAYGTYTLDPGAHTGWRRVTGSAIVAVTEGVLAVRSAAGCAVRQLEAGKAELLAAGRYLFAAAGERGVTFAASFAGIPRGAPEPFGEGAVERSWACGVGGGGASTPSVSDPARGTFAAPAEYGHSGHGAGARSVTAVEGADVMASAYELQPGFGTGWVTHGPAIGIVRRGTITYYEEQHGQCAVSETWGPGEAFVHHADSHVHMAVNDGTEPVGLSVFYLNLPGSQVAGVPYVGNTLDAYDFTPVPPAGCPRLR